MGMKKMKKRKRTTWNKNRELGQREPFSPPEVIRIRKQLAKRGDGGLRDLALFSISIDTMLRLPHLLGLTVKDVRKRNRVMRDTLDLTTADKGRPIQCTLTCHFRLCVRDMRSNAPFLQLMADLLVKSKFAVPVDREYPG